MLNTMLNGLSLAILTHTFVFIFIYVYIYIYTYQSKKYDTYMVEKVSFQDCNHIDEYDRVQLGKVRNEYTVFTNHNQSLLLLESSALKLSLSLWKKIFEACMAQVKDYSCCTVGVQPSLSRKMALEEFVRSS